MMYGTDILVQIENLMPAMGFGFLLAVVLDLFTFLRICFQNGKIIGFIIDFTSVVFCFVSSFLMIVAVNDGIIRAYLVFAEMLAVLIYKVSIGRLFSRLTEKLALKINKRLTVLLSNIVNVCKKLKKVFPPRNNKTS